MASRGSIFLGKELLGLLEGNSTHTSPQSSNQKEPQARQSTDRPQSTINNIIINNYNGNVLKNITNLKP